MTDSGVEQLFADDRITTFGLLVEAHRRLQRTFDKSLRDHHDMTGVTYEALIRLARTEGRQMSMSELADQMVLTSGGATRLVDRLAEAGFVERLHCPTDRRVLWVHLSEHGESALAAATETHLNDLQEHFASEIDPDELPVFTEVLDRLRRGCTAQR